MDLKTWTQSRKIFCEIDNETLISGDIVGYVYEDDPCVFFTPNNNFEFYLDFDEVDEFYTHIIYYFCARWYIQKINREGPNVASFDLLENIGHPDKSDFPLLNVIHGKYEVYNGIGTYDRWLDHISFLGGKFAIIAEKNTLGGVPEFVEECEKREIKPILGITLELRNKRGLLAEVTFLAKNEKGWAQIIELSNLINYHQPEETDIKVTKDVAVIIGPDFPIIPGETIKKFPSLYFNVEPCLRQNKEHAESYFKNLDRYFSQLNPIGSPIILHHAYCLYPDQMRPLSIIRHNQDMSSRFTQINEYFDFLENSLDILLDRYGDKISLEDVVKNCKNFSDKFNFSLSFDQILLPEFPYEGDKEELFFSLLIEGLESLVAKKGVDYDQYWERIETEVAVISLLQSTSGNASGIDYFLILWDICKFCRENDILVGVGRGSAGGCLVSYLLGITQIDPIKYDLLFERFLNEGRIESGLPDIDVDFPTHRRPEVKRYMEEKYGDFQVCSVGTYNTYKIKGALFDLLRNADKEVKGQGAYISKVLGGTLNGDSEISYLLEAIGTSSKVFDFFSSYPVMLNDIHDLLGTARAKSVHPCATIIVPHTIGGNKGANILNSLPIRSEMGKDDQEIIVSDWEGSALESMGFLKEDILGINQLSKFSDILELIEKNKGEKLNLNSIPFDDESVYSRFKMGWNGDVFHFGSSGLTSYLKQLQPDNMEDLIAAISLFRPGAMQSGSHMKYIHLKNGDVEPEYDYKLEEVTTSTYGIYIYQEQIMKAVQILGGFDLGETDGIRKAMGKKKDELMKSYGEQFIENAVSLGCPKDEAKAIWGKLKLFSGYGFNRSHAAAYSIIGYTCQWLKTHYPLEFWTVALGYANDEDVFKYMAELYESRSPIKIKSVDINKSFEKFHCDQEHGVIYWGLLNVNFLGEKVAKQIIKERNERGKFFDMEEFFKRCPFISIRVAENLLISGAFDKLCGIEEDIIYTRFDWLEGLYFTHKTSKKWEKVIDKFDEDKITDNNYWKLLQKQICGFAFFKYREIFSSFGDDDADFLSASDLQDEDYLRETVWMGGYVVDVQIRSSRKGGNFATLLVDENSNMYFIQVWPEDFPKWRNKIEACKNQIILVKGVVSYDKFHNEQVLYFDDESKFKII